MLRKKTACMAYGELRSVCIVKPDRRGAPVFVFLDWLDLSLARLLRRVIVWNDCIMMHRICKVVVLHSSGCRCGRQ